MRRSILIAAALAASSIAGAASAAELLIANIMPATTVWDVDGARFITVPTGQHGIKPFSAGTKTVKVTDTAGRSATETVVFNATQTARSGTREFWCLASRAKDGAPELLVLDQATCQQFLVNQPPK